MADQRASPRPGPVVALAAAIGAWIIYRLIWLFGRTHRCDAVPWLMGPLGGEVIGDSPYREVAAAEGLGLERDVRDGGLVPDFAALRAAGFNPDRVDPLVREFYERTAGFAMDVWSRTYFPASIALRLLVTTISRQVDQLNFPLSPLETARGMLSEIIALRAPDGSPRYTGWFRRLAEGDRVLYTGFYMLASPPAAGAPCVKVVFPMPRGNATVILRPRAEDGALILDSAGSGFGDAGFYRMQARDGERMRVWRVRSLVERFRVYVDAGGTLRCDHHVRFLGLPVLALHYKMSRRDPAAGAPAA